MQTATNINQISQGIINTKIFNVLAVQVVLSKNQLSNMFFFFKLKIHIFLTDKT